MLHDALDSDKKLQHMYYMCAPVGPGVEVNLRGTRVHPGEGGATGLLLEDEGVSSHPNNSHKLMLNVFVGTLCMYM